MPKLPKLIAIPLDRRPVIRALPPEADGEARLLPLVSSPARTNFGRALSPVGLVPSPTWP